jgi:N-acetyl-anhydromuramyl-L-alanine amidase AmpD
MLAVNKDGMVVDTRVAIRRFPGIEHGQLQAVHAIVIHQSDTSTTQNSFNGYQSGTNGAHFLIATDGGIYQTASLRKRCYHVGRLIKSKCLAVNRGSCDSTSIARILALSWAAQIEAIDTLERGKNYPVRYPVNSDSVGIEMVGKSIDAKSYEAVTLQQNTSLQWLVGELYALFGLSSSDVYRHPDVSYKNPGEASTAKWK